MATTGINYAPSGEIKAFAIQYVEDTGLAKNRLASVLRISRPTLDRVLKDDDDFFTDLVRADSIFCKKLIIAVQKKNPMFILRTRCKSEFS